MEWHCQWTNFFSAVSSARIWLDDCRPPFRTDILWCRYCKVSSSARVTYHGESADAEPRFSSHTDDVLSGEPLCILPSLSTVVQSKQEVTKPISCVLNHWYVTLTSARWRGKPDVNDDRCNRLRARDWYDRNTYKQVIMFNTDLIRSDRSDQRTDLSEVRLYRSWLWSITDDNQTEHLGDLSRALAAG